MSEFEKAVLEVLVGMKEVFEGIQGELAEMNEYLFEIADAQYEDCEEGESEEGEEGSEQPLSVVPDA